MSTMPPASASRRTSASESWLPDTNTNGCPRPTIRRTSVNSKGDPLEVRSPAKKSGREPTARSSAGSASRLLWRSEARTAPRRSPWAAPRRRGHEPGEPHELLVQILGYLARRSLRLLDRAQRDRDVGPVGVVLRVGDLPARREQEGERETERERGAGGGAEKPAEPGSAAPAHGQRHDQPDGEPDQQHQEQELPQVGGDRVAGLPSDCLHVRELALRHALGGVAVDRPHVDRQARREAHRGEARAPVHERDVEVERARVEGLNGQLDAAHAQVALRAVGGERQQSPAEYGDHDKGHRGDAADGPHRPQASGSPRGGYS